MKLKMTLSVAIAAVVMMPAVLAAPPRVVEDPADAEIGPLDVLSVWLKSDGQHLTVTATVRDLTQPDPVDHGLDFYRIAVRLRHVDAPINTMINLYADVYLQETSHLGMPNARYVDAPREAPQVPTSPGTYAWLYSGSASARYYLEDVDVRFDPAESTITWTVPYTMTRQGSVFALAKVEDQVFRSGEYFRGPLSSQGSFVETMKTIALESVDTVAAPADYNFVLE